jgi:nucleoside-diphosphate-sugar epimerase
MVLPREFRRLRIAIIGYGDVARRIVNQNARHQRHGPRLILIGRSVTAGTESSNPSRHAALRWDLDRPQTAKQITRLASAAIMLAPPAESPTLTEDLRSRRLAIGVRQTMRRPPWVYISTTGVYGDHRGAVVNETTRCSPKQPRSRRRLDAERAFRPLGAHILRVPGIYGHDRLPTARLAAAQPALLAKDDVFTNHIHAEDLATICWLALFRGLPGRVTNAVDQSQLKMADYFDAVADATELPRPPRVSKDTMMTMGREGKIHPMMLGFLSESRQVTTQRLDQELGVRLRFPTVHDTLMTLRPTSRQS